MLVVCFVVRDVAWRLVGRGNLMKQSIDEIVAAIEEECGSVGGCLYYFTTGLSDTSFWISPKMRCLMFRVACRQMYEHLRGSGLARKTEGDQRDGKPVQWAFVDVKLSDDQMEAALLMWGDPDELWDVAIQSMIEGYKLSLSRDEESDSYCAALTGKDCIPENRNKTITAWYDTAGDAMRLLLYKHYVAAASGWGTSESKGKRRG